MGGPGYGRRARSGPVAGLPPGGRLGRDTAVTRHHLDDLVHGARRDWFAWIGWARLDWLGWIGYCETRRRSDQSWGPRSTSSAAPHGSRGGPSSVRRLAVAFLASWGSRAARRASSAARASTCSD